MKKKLKLYLRNIGLWLNNGLMCAIGKHPWMTISAFAYLQPLPRLVRLINWVYRDPDHCRVASLGWDQERLRARNLW